MATVTSTRPYHIIIFGASGFTGQFVVEEVARSAFEGPSGSLKWALAGRSRQRLDGVLNQAAETLRTCLTLIKKHKRVPAVSKIMILCQAWFD